MRKVIFALAMIMVGVCGCKESRNEHSTGNAVYHWKSTFKLSAADSAFIEQHNIGRMYVRFFDVVDDYSYGAVPNATVYFWSAVPNNLEIVPTIFITLEALQTMEDHETELADKIRTRIKEMTKGNGIKNVHEVQVDCDWTESTEESFFTLCQTLRKMLQTDSLKLSSTIRLHQLSRKAPPVDRGVLMLYNTGSVKNAETKNSILSYDVVKAYLKDGNYALPLDFAYPAFSWGVVFRNGMFQRLEHIPDSAVRSQKDFEHLHDNWYRVARNSWEYDIEKGELMRYESVDADEILKVKRLVERFYGDKPHSNIIYHLDETELSKYSATEIDRIYE